MAIIFTRSAADADQAWRLAKPNTTIYLNNKIIGTVLATDAATDEKLRQLHASEKP